MASGNERKSSSTGAAFMATLGLGSSATPAAPPSQLLTSAAKQGQQVQHHQGTISANPPRPALRDGLSSVHQVTPSSQVTAPAASPVPNSAAKRNGAREYQPHENAESTSRKSTIFGKEDPDFVLVTLPRTNGTYALKLMDNGIEMEKAIVLAYHMYKHTMDGLGVKEALKCNNGPAMMIDDGSTSVDIYALILDSGKDVITKMARDHNQTLKTPSKQRKPAPIDSHSYPSAASQQPSIGDMFSPITTPPDTPNATQTNGQYYYQTDQPDGGSQSGYSSSDSGEG